MTGSNLDEHKFFAMLKPETRKLDEVGLLRELSQVMLPEKAEVVIETYRRLKQERAEPVTPFELFSAIKSDLRFRQIAIYIAECQAKNGAAAYNYLFTWKSPAAGGTLGACHTLEVGFVFGTLDPGFCGKGPVVEKLAGEIQDAWAAFAATGNPSSSGLGKWTPYGASRSSMIFSEDSHLEKAVYEAERKVWLKVGEVDLS
jgi:para-nitrobenzyl esterase